jgi:hypothetical protein
VVLAETSLRVPFGAQQYENSAKCRASLDYVPARSGPCRASKRAFGRVCETAIPRRRLGLPAIGLE